MGSDNPYFSVPRVSGDGPKAFQLEGNSMEPVIRHGDIVICKELENLADIRDNEIYAVRTGGNTWVKYVLPLRRYSGGLITHLKLISANYFDHDPFEEEVNDTTKVYKVIRKISTL